MSLLDTRRPCIRCSQPVFPAVPICTSCGNPQPVASEGGRFGVTVGQVVGMRQRDQLVEIVTSWLDPTDVAQLKNDLGKKGVLLVDGLSFEVATSLADALKNQHFASEVVDVSSRKSSLKRALPAVIGGLLLGGIAAALVGAFVSGIFGALVGVLCLVAVVIVFAKRYSPQSMAAAKAEDPSLPGWAEAAPRLTELYRQLPDQQRDKLARITSAVAEIQSDLASESAVAFASGGLDGQLGKAMRLMLRRAVDTAQALLNKVGNAGQAFEELEQTADDARRRYLQLHEAAESDSAIELGEQLNAALSEAEEVVEAVQTT